MKTKTEIIEKAIKEAVESAYQQFGIEGIRALSMFPSAGRDALNGESQLQQCQIDHMVDRFLSWELPRDFDPDGGISVQTTKGSFTPVGTNLFTAKQARDMILHLLGQDNP